MGELTVMAMVIFLGLLVALSLVVSIYAIIRIEVHERLAPQEAVVPSHELFTGTKDLYRQPEASDERTVREDDIFQGDLDFQEIP